MRDSWPLARRGFWRAIDRRWLCSWLREHCAQTRGTGGPTRGTGVVGGRVGSRGQVPLSISGLHIILLDQGVGWSGGSVHTMWLVCDVYEKMCSLIVICM